MDNIIIADLHACVNCLGSFDNGVFLKDVDTNASIRDMLRYLRRESKSCEIRIELGKLNVISRYLIPLLKQCKDDNVLFDLLIRLLMNLTQPAFICFKLQMPTDIHMEGIFIKVNKTLQKCKQSFADFDVMSTLSASLETMFKKPWEDRSEEENMLVERVLIVVRNVLHIDTLQANDEEALDGTWSTHDRLLHALLGQGGWTELIVYLANTEDEHRFAFHVLEILSLVFKEQTADIMRSEKVTSNEGNSRLKQLLQQQEKEAAAERARLNQRALRYDGAFELSGIKGASGLPMAYHHDLSGGVVDLRLGRKLRVRPRQRQPAGDIAHICRQSPPAVVALLRRLCALFLEHGYVTLMAGSRRRLNHNQQPDDICCYLWAVGFFSKACRVAHMQPAIAAATCSPELLIWTLEQIIDHRERAKSEKKKAAVHYRRMQVAVAACNELLRLLLALDRCKEEQYRKCSAHVKGAVFYREELLDLFPGLLRNFKESHQTRTLLRELIEASSLLIDILQNHKSFDMSVVRTMKKKRRKHSKKKADVGVEEVEVVMPTDEKEQLDPIWARIEARVGAAVAGQEPLPDEAALPCIYDYTLPDAREPIEPGSDPVDIQLKKALGIVQLFLRRERPLEAVAVLRLARTMWPDEERMTLGTEEDEVAMLRALLLAPRFYSEGDLAATSNTKEDPPGDEDDEVSEEEEEEEYVAEEKLFDIDEFAIKFADPGVVRTYDILFREFASSPASTNSSLLRVMHRIAVKMHLPMALYQLRIFRSFSVFLQSPQSRQPAFKEHHKFVLHILKSFTAHCQKNEKLFVEVLFPKKRQHLLHIVRGDPIETETGAVVWTPEMDEELERLFEEARAEGPPPGLDVADMIEGRLGVTVTRRQLLARMVILGLIDSAKDLRPATVAQMERPWTGEETARLVVLVEEYIDQPNAIKFIMNGMRAGAEDPSDARTRRSVVKKAIELELVADKEELGIRTRGPRRKKAGVIFEDEEESANDTEEEDEYEQSPPREKRVPPPYKPKRLIDWAAFKSTFASLSLQERVWFLDMLAENMDTRANGSVGPLALIPVSDEDRTSLESVGVQRLLTICHILSPDSGTAIDDFWRIPEEMGAKELGYCRNCASSLSEEELASLATGFYQPEESDLHIGEPLFGSDLDEQEEEDKDLTVVEEADKENLTEVDVGTVMIATKMRRGMIVDSDEEEDEQEEEDKENLAVVEDEVDVGTVMVATKRRRGMIVDSDEEENEQDGPIVGKRRLTVVVDDDVY